MLGVRQALTLDDSLLSSGLHYPPGEQPLLEESGCLCVLKDLLQTLGRARASGYIASPQGSLVA